MTWFDAAMAALMVAVTPWCYRTSREFTRWLTNPKPKRVVRPAKPIKVPGLTHCDGCGVWFLPHKYGCPRCSPKRTLHCIFCRQGLADAVKTFPEFGHRPVCWHCYMQRKE